MIDAAAPSRAARPWAGLAERVAGAGPTLVAVGAPALLLLVLALFRLDAKSFWFDEVFSVQATESGLRGIARLAVGGEANMALYYTALWAWLGLGSGDAWTRLLSAIFAVATVPVVYLLGRDVAGRRVGILAAVAFAGNAFVVQYAQEARSYSMAMLFVAVILLSGLRALRDGSRVGWIVFVLASGAAAYVHLFVALTVLAVVTVGIIAPPHPSDRRKLILAVVAIGILALPVELVVLLRQGGQLVWVQPTSVETIANTALAIAGTGTVADRATPAAWGLVLAWGGLVAYGMVPSGAAEARWRFDRILLIAAVVMPVVVVLLVSLVKPIFVPRFFAILVPPGVVLAAMALARLRLSLRVAAIAIVAVLAAQGLRTLYFERPKHDWRAATAYVVDAIRGDDRLIVYEWWNRRQIEYYADQQAAGRSLPSMLSPGLRSVDPIAYAEALRAGLTTVPVGGSVWLILAAASGGTPRLDDPRFAPLVARYRVAAEVDFFGVHVLRLDPLPAE